MAECGVPPCPLSNLIEYLNGGERRERGELERGKGGKPMQPAVPFLLRKAQPPRVPNGKEIECHLENERHRSGGKRMGKGVAGGVSARNEQISVY